MGMPASLAALASALAVDTLETWLAGLEPEALRSRIRRALAIDRRLCTQYPDSLASCLLARTFGDPAFAHLHAAWTQELERSGVPWIRPLRALPVAGGLVAELHAGAGLSFTALALPRFTSNDEVVVVARRLHPKVQPPEQRRRERLRWAWAADEAVIEADPQADEPAQSGHFPQIAQDGWGPAYLVRSPGTQRIALPCPDEGSADARFTADGARLIVYGTLDEYAGGFVWIVDPQTLAVERTLATGSPVSAVAEGNQGQMLVSTYHNGTIAWIDGRAQQLPDLVGALCLSPDGLWVASFAGSLQIWSLSELLRIGGSPPEAGFPARFDPNGNRLICGRQLLDGRSGRPIARLDVSLGAYLEGGPAQPWLYFGTGALICSHGGLRLWDTHSGAPLAMKQHLRFPYWYTLAYDRAGARLAVLRKGDTAVALHGLPRGVLLRTLSFELAGSAVAMSPDGEQVAIQEGAAIEVRTAEGALVRRFGDPATNGAEHRGRFGDATLKFSTDGQRVAWFVEGEGWRIASLAGEAEVQHLAEREALAEVPDFAPPLPRDWAIEVNTTTIFTHRPSGARIALPVAGPWVFNPGDRRIAACNEMHLELCGP